ncbi:MAG: polysaccharide deacetylase family protein [Parvularculaceae bacterium]
MINKESLGQELRLISCIHDVTPLYFDRLREIVNFYDRIGIGHTFAMLVVPDFWSAWRLDKHPEFVRWLRELAESGVEIFLHGYYHKFSAPPSERSLLLRAQFAILGEGEFSNATYEEAFTKIRTGKELLEEQLGVTIDKFVAPAWQYSEATRRSLGALKFRIAEDRRHVWDPLTGASLTATPVIAYSGRTPLRRNLSIGWSQLASIVLNNAQVVRHAIHPADFGNEILIKEIGRSISTFLSHRLAATYEDCLC